MRKSLFALENADGMDAGEEMEVSQEEGEVADVAVGADDEIGEIGDVADAVSDGADAAGQMEEVEGLVEDAVENGEGLDPVAAEAVRISVEAICARIGANPKAVYSLYATENFASASSRRANSRIALEGIGDFLKDLWKRIKTALTNMWKKVKDFWAKHLSSLGRVKKALEATKTKVRASSGNFKQSAMIENPPNSLASDFAGKGVLDHKRVQLYITNQTALKVSGTKIGEALTKVSALGNKTTGATDPAGVHTGLNDALTNLKTDSQETIIIGGDKLKIVTDIDDDGKKLTVDIEKNSSEEADTEAGMLAAKKEELATLLDNTLVVIKEAIDTRKNFEKAEKASNEALAKIEGIINSNAPQADGTANAGGMSKDQSEAIRKVMNGMYKLNSAAAKIQGIIASQNIRLAKAVIGFCNVSMKQYKPK